MTYDEAVAELQSLGEPKVREMNARNGVTGPQFGVKMGAIRDLAKRIKTDPELGGQLWRSGNFDAMMLGTLLMKPKALRLEELDEMVAAVPYPQVADWFGTNVVKQHPLKESRRELWMASADSMTARMGWSLTAERIIKDPDGLDFDALLDRIEREMASAAREVQWTMNYALAEIGIRSEPHRERAIAIGEKLGIFRDYPTSKGCTSPYAPVWIAEMVGRQS